VSDLLEAVDELLAAHPADQDDRALREARFDAGLAFVHFDPGAGGRGLDASLQAEVERRFLAAGHMDWSDRNIIGLGMAAPVIHEHGSPEQRARFLRPLFTGEEVWCQLFSEPGSGSDLAGLSSRAELDGDEWVVSGQKVWTTLGHVARRGLLVARTDPDVPKHRGLTYFLLDMRSPGVDVRPLRQMTGDAEFNEVYLTDVRIPDHDRIGGVGDGWRVAMSTLMNERVSLGGGAGERGSGPIGEAVELFRAARAQGRAGAAARPGGGPTAPVRRRAAPGGTRCGRSAGRGRAPTTATRTGPAGRTGSPTGGRPGAAARGAPARRARRAGRAVDAAAGS